MEVLRRDGGIGDFEGAERIDDEAFWDVDCDILIPAALEGQITPDARQPHQGQAGARRRQRPDRCPRPTTCSASAASWSCPT